ncbi:MAG TPA: GDYXXLXY domain-containing protein [Candidatus Peribacteraceae bacterium]|nr:GDYXXLXY domain-containing protein [Candidatus Peribacteraceae bacterium]
MNRRVLFLVGLLFELVAVFGLFVPYVMLQETGTPVTLRTVPVDPRSIFRGDYVVLGYQVGDDLPVTDDYNKPIWITLEKKDDVYVRVHYGDEKPVLEPGQLCLLGRRNYERADFPDISQYFVPEGTGLEIEQARNYHRLLVDAVVNDDCRAVITGLRLGQEVSDTELPEWMRGTQFPPMEEVPTKPAPVNP